MSQVIEILGAVSDLASLLAAAQAVTHVARSWIRPTRRPARSSVLRTPLDREQGVDVIEIIGRSGEPEASNCPALICDGCRKQVTSSGNIIWGSTVGVEPRLSTPLFVSHKGQCDEVVQQGLQVEYPGDEWVWLWEEAAEFLGDLAGNFTRPFEEDAASTFHEHRIALSQRPAPR